MADDGRIDIFQEFVSLSKQEQMLAFFDFELATGSPAPVSGLCRISKPKRGEARTPYVSLTFVVDTPDERTKTAIHDALARLEAEPLKSAVPGVQELLPVPVINLGAENFVWQADVLLEPVVKLEKDWLAQRLIPAVQRITRIKATEVVWWDDRAAPPASTPSATGSSPAPQPSLLSSIRQYLNKYRT